MDRIFLSLGIPVWNQEAVGRNFYPYIAPMKYFLSLLTSLSDETHQLPACCHLLNKMSYLNESICTYCSVMEFLRGSEKFDKDTNYNGYLQYGLPFNS